MSVHYRRIAGNLEMFSGAYFVAAGTLAAIYFQWRHHPIRALLCVAGALIGILLLARANRLLAWRSWLYWTLVTILVVVPIVWLLPPLLTSLQR
jgi:hypothetical protein